MPIHPPTRPPTVNEKHLPQGQDILKSLRTLVTAYVDKMGSMASSDGIAGLFQRYTGEGAPDHVKQLQAQLEKATTDDSKADLQRKLQKAIADDVWGGRE